ncbi:uncharacterized protein LOC116290811, partial [Actinia tenebrosa]|uniref:Uncharacterized protein LOC116290811 n=1 Tax=Actinia tenebrosa TaxID=6105 RepID=A0A6P8HDM0_ACTTE
MCFKAKVGATCRTWNETRCPNGEVKIDYSDPTRIENTQIKGNVTIISPEKVTMYRCAANDLDDNIVTVFVFNANLTLKPGNVISSNQAGGVFHKVSDVKEFEPYTFVTADPASIEDFIQYADFQIDATLASLQDEVTVEAEPDMEMLNILMYRNVSLNETLFIVPSDTFVYKCVGHMYEADQKKVASYYLVLNASNTPFMIEAGDVIVSNQSHGFLSTITSINKTSEFSFVETFLMRCDKNTEMNVKFHDELTNGDIMGCPGGDNNPNLLIKETNNEIFNMSVNDVIVDRSSQAFAGKVKSFHYSNGYLMVEVFPITTVFNGTAITEIEITKTISHVRRKRFVIPIFSKRFQMLEKKWNFDFPVPGKNTIGFFLHLSFGFTVGMQLEVSSIRLNKLKRPSVRLALFLTTDAAAKIGVSLKTNLELSFSEEKSIVPSKSLARFVLCIFIFCIPTGIFFNLDATANINAEFTTQLAVSYSLRISNVGIKGECSTSGWCKTSLTKPKTTNKWNFNFDMDAKLSGRFTLTPRLSLQIPSLPKLPSQAKKLKWVTKVVTKIKKKGGNPFAAKLWLEIPIIVDGSTSLCSRHCHPKKRLVLKAGAKKIKVAIYLGDSELWSKSFGC